MNKIKKFCLLTTAICGLAALASFNTACSNLTNWVEDHPTEVNLAKAGLLTGLNAFLANNPDYAVHGPALKGAINFALSPDHTPDEAAALLDAQTLEVFDDPDVRASLLAAWQAELDKRTTLPEGLPAAGPAVDYARELSNALGNSTAQILPADPIVTTPRQKPGKSVAHS